MDVEMDVGLMETISAIATEDSLKTLSMIVKQLARHQIGVLASTTTYNINAGL